MAMGSGLGLGATSREVMTKTYFPWVQLVPVTVPAAALYEDPLQAAADNRLPPPLPLADGRPTILMLASLGTPLFTEGGTCTHSITRDEQERHSIATEDTPEQ